MKTQTRIGRRQIASYKRGKLRDKMYYWSMSQKIKRFRIMMMRPLPKLSYQNIWEAPINNKFFTPDAIKKAVDNYNAKIKEAMKKMKDAFGDKPIQTISSGNKQSLLTADCIALGLAAGGKLSISYPKSRPVESGDLIDYEVNWASPLLLMEESPAVEPEDVTALAAKLVPPPTSLSIGSTTKESKE